MKENLTDREKQILKKFSILVNQTEEDLLDMDIEYRFTKDGGFYRDVIEEDIYSTLDTYTLVIEEDDNGSTLNLKTHSEVISNSGLDKFELMEALFYKHLAYNIDSYMPNFKYILFKNELLCDVLDHYSAYYNQLTPTIAAYIGEWDISINEELPELKFSERRSIKIIEKKNEEFILLEEVEAIYYPECLAKYEVKNNE